jgi:hypothetical protein
VLYRRRDIVALAEELRAAGHGIELKFDPGSGRLDRHADWPPYRPHNHLKMRALRWPLLFAATSIGLVVVKKTE